MDLKQRKLIQNSNITLPHFEPGAEPGIEPGKVPFGQKLTAGMQGLLGMAQMFSQYEDAKDPGISPQEMIKNGGTQHVGDESF